MENRKYLNIFCTEEEMMEMRLIQTRNTCARQAAQVQSIPQGVSKEDLNLFVKAAIEALADATLMEQLWWERVIKKYNLRTVEPNKPIYLDFDIKDFYILEG